MNDEPVWQVQPVTFGWIVYNKDMKHHLCCGEETLFYFSEYAAQIVADAMNLMNTAILSD